MLTHKARNWWVQAEGLSLAKRNGELEAVARRLKAAARGSGAEHQRMLSRVEQLESELAREHARYSQASQAAGEQVLGVQCNAVHVNMLALISAVTALQHGYHKLVLRLASALHAEFCLS